MAGDPRKRERRERSVALYEDARFWDSVFDEMARGISLLESTRLRDLPYRTTLDRINASPDLQSRYEAARRARAGWHASHIERLIEEVEQGRLDSRAAKVAIEGRQWLASRMDPKLWAERQQIDVKHTSMGQLHLEAIRALSERKVAERAAARAEAIDAEIISVHSISDQRAS